MTQSIDQYIRDRHSISIAEFMVLHNDQGYRWKKSSIGVNGDFITAPEISQAFGEIIAMWCLAMWRPQASGHCLVELGPGRGTMMNDMLRALEGRDFVQAMSLYLVEHSPALKRQQQAYKRLGGGHWIESLNDLPEDRPLTVIANEFFDSLPIEQYVKDQGHWRQRIIRFDERRQSLAFDLGDLVADDDIPLPDHVNFVEFSPQRLQSMETLANRLVKDGGVALIIDYGYGQPLYRDTLQAIYQHQCCAVLDHLGQADLSSHVDFYALATVAQAQGAKVWGPVGQGGFLESLGLWPRTMALAKQSKPSVVQALYGGAMRLSVQGPMADLFKVMAVTDPSYQVVDGLERWGQASPVQQPNRA